LLTKFSFGKNVSNATFRDPLGEETKKIKTRLIYFSCIAIIIGSFDFEFKGIAGVITFSSNPPTFLIAGILGFGVVYYLSLFAFYLWDDYLKWNNEIIIENTNHHWKLLGSIDSKTDINTAMLSTINNRIDDISNKVFFSSEFIESEDSYLKETLGSSYITLENYIKGEKGISLREFRDKTRPFCQKLGNEAAKYLLEKKIQVEAPGDVNIYAVNYYLNHVLHNDIEIQSEKFSRVAKEIVEQFGNSIKRFQYNNLGLTINQSIMLIIVEFFIPVALACIGLLIVSCDITRTFYGIYEKLISIII